MVAEVSLEWEEEERAEKQLDKGIVGLGCDVGVVVGGLEVSLLDFEVFGCYWMSYG